MAEEQVDKEYTHRLLDSKDRIQAAGSRENLEKTLQLIGSFLGSVTVLTALLYVFGWAYVNAYFHYFAIDPSVLNLTTTTYLLKSVNSLFWPFIILSLLWILIAGWHQEVNQRFRAREWSWVHRAERIVRLIGMACVLGGLVGALVLGQKFNLAVYLATPIGLTTGTALIAYATYMSRRLDTETSPDAQGKEAGHSRLIVGLALPLVLISLFWSVFNYADAAGRGRAIQTAARIDQLPGATIYSEKRQRFGPWSVHETALGGTELAYRFKYTGLRLLMRSGDDYFLLSSDWSPDDSAVIVLHRTDAIRLEFQGS
jgi:hypothetical protein